MSSLSHNIPIEDSTHWNEMIRFDHINRSRHIGSESIILLSSVWKWFTERLWKWITNNQNLHKWNEWNKSIYQCSSERVCTIFIMCRMRLTQQPFKCLRISPIIICMFFHFHFYSTVSFTYMRNFDSCAHPYTHSSMKNHMKANGYGTQTSWCCCCCCSCPFIRKA